MPAFYHFQKYVISMMNAPCLSFTTLKWNSPPPWPVFHASNYVLMEGKKWSGRVSENMHRVRPFRHVTVAHGNWTEVSWTYWSDARFQRLHMWGLKTASKQRELLWSLLFPPPCLYLPSIPVGLGHKSGRLQLDRRVKGARDGRCKSPNNWNLIAKFIILTSFDDSASFAV